MKILGIESSCDETAAAVVESSGSSGLTLLSNVVVSQIDIHREFGGVVPEVAARSHLEVITPVIDKALTEAECTWNEIDGIGVTQGPGLSGSLLIGTLAARTLAVVKQKPLYGVHHVLGHTYANFLVNQTSSGDYELPSSAPEFPVLALIVSGGHSQLVLFKDHFTYELLGQTRDDAVGEAFDKVAKVIGLPYPGGPSISREAPNGNDQAYDFPIANLDSPFDFSFSGLKTAVLRAAQAEIGEDYSFPSYRVSKRLSDAQRANFAASFQRTAIKTLVDATAKAVDAFSPASIVIAGGVAANRLLREELSRRITSHSIAYADPRLCTDNAAMIAALTCFQAEAREPDDPFALPVRPSWSM